MSEKVDHLSRFSFGTDKILSWAEKLDRRSSLAFRIVARGSVVLAAPVTLTVSFVAYTLFGMGELFACVVYSPLKVFYAQSKIKPKINFSFQRAFSNLRVGIQHGVAAPFFFVIPWIALRESRSYLVDGKEALEAEIKASSTIKEMKETIRVFEEKERDQALNETRECQEEESVEPFEGTHVEDEKVVSEGCQIEEVSADYAREEDEDEGLGQVDVNEVPQEEIIEEMSKKTLGKFQGTIRIKRKRPETKEDGRKTFKNLFKRMIEEKNYTLQSHREPLTREETRYFEQQKDNPFAVERLYRLLSRYLETLKEIDQGEEEDLSETLGNEATVDPLLRRSTRQLHEAQFSKGDIEEVLSRFQAIHTILKEAMEEEGKRRIQSKALEVRRQYEAKNARQREARARRAKRIARLKDQLKLDDMDLESQTGKARLFQSCRDVYGDSKASQDELLGRFKSELKQVSDWLDNTQTGRNKRFRSLHQTLLDIITCTKGEAHVVQAYRKNLAGGVRRQ